MRALIPLQCILGALSAFSVSVTLLNGEMHVGDLTLADRFTLKISSSSGILFFPLAALSEADLDRVSLQNFGVSASRQFSGEPRFWRERREALRSATAAGADPGRFAALQAEIDSQRDLIALYRDQMIQKERSAYARREYAAMVRGANLNDLKNAQHSIRPDDRTGKPRAAIDALERRITAAHSEIVALEPSATGTD